MFAAGAEDVGAGAAVDSADEEYAGGDTGADAGEDAGEEYAGGDAGEETGEDTGADAGAEYAGGEAGAEAGLEYAGAVGETGAKGDDVGGPPVAVTVIVNVTLVVMVVSAVHCSFSMGEAVDCQPDGIAEGETITVSIAVVVASSDADQAAAELAAAEADHA